MSIDENSDEASLVEEVDEVEEVESDDEVEDEAPSGGGGGAFACMKLDSSSSLTDPSPSVSIDEKMSLEVEDEEVELVVESVEVEELDVLDDVVDELFSCSDNRALRVSSENWEMKLDSSLDDRPPDESVSTEENRSASGSDAELPEEEVVEDALPVESVADVDDV